MVFCSICNFSKYPRQPLFWLWPTGIITIWRIPCSLMGKWEKHWRLSSNPRETRVVLKGNGYLKKSANLKALLAYLTICDRKENLKEHFFMSIRINSTCHKTMETRISFLFFLTSFLFRTDRIRWRKQKEIKNHIILIHSVLSINNICFFPDFQWLQNKLATNNGNRIWQMTTPSQQ